MHTPSQAMFPTCVFPPTRYQGSKRKLADRIVAAVADLEFETVLDAFGGTAAVAHAFKWTGARVTYNDHLAFNHQIGIALIENDSVAIEEREIRALGVRSDTVAYNDTIERLFADIYFTPDENRFLDTAVANIRALTCRFKRAIAWYALAQAAMAKRPYNLFHRRNLYMRTAKVDRSFGNKTTWERSFPDHMAKVVADARTALIDSGGSCSAICHDALELAPDYDLVYIDTPYINKSGQGVPYRDFYHFLEGMVAHYDDWPDKIDHKSKHLRLAPRPDPWSCPTEIHDQFRKLIHHFADSILIISYRSDGIPSIDELVAMAREAKPKVHVLEGKRYQYALSTNRKSHEVLIIASS